MKRKRRIQPTNVDASANPRRFRSSSQATGKAYVLTPRKLRILQALRHGPAPTALLNRPFYGGQPGWHGTVQKNLTDLFHEEYEGQKLVYRPGELNPDKGPGCQQAVYDLTPKGMEVAEVHVSVPRRDHPRHRVMGACIDLSFEQLGPEHGVVFHDQEEVLAHPNCPSETQNSGNPLLIELDGAKLEPDRLFKFESKATGLFRYWAREDCRGTVDFSNSSTKKISNKEKLDHYLELLTSKVYQKHWGLPNLSIMFVMTSEDRIDNMIHYLQGKKYAERFHFKALPQFSTKKWEYPKEPISELFTPWRTPHGLKDITK